MAPLLSMTVANYNYASSCRRNIESMGETFGDFELILIDNASTDDSVDVLRKFAAADPRIRVVTHGEKGA